jgi:hypothetical protein
MVEMRRLKAEGLTSSYCHIEVAMAFKQALPLLILQGGRRGSGGRSRSRLDGWLHRVLR